MNTHDNQGHPETVRYFPIREAIKIKLKIKAFIHKLMKKFWLRTPLSCTCTNANVSFEKTEYQLANYALFFI